MTEPLADWEKDLLAPRTVRIVGAPKLDAQPAGFDVPLVAAIEAVQNAGYLVYELGELPEVTQDGNGKPKLPPYLGEPVAANRAKTKAQLFYEEAFGKLALARWWEKEEVRRQKRIASLAVDLEQTLRHSDMTAFATDLVERGWRRVPH